MGVGFVITSLSMLCWDSYFDIMRLGSGKEPAVDIVFNVLDRTKKLLLMSN